MVRLLGRAVYVACPAHRRGRRGAQDSYYDDTLSSVRRRCRRGSVVRGATSRVTGLSDVDPAGLSAQDVEDRARYRRRRSGTEAGLLHDHTEGVSRVVGRSDTDEEGVVLLRGSLCRSRLADDRVDLERESGEGAGRGPLGEGGDPLQARTDRLPDRRVDGDRPGHPGLEDLVDPTVSGLDPEPDVRGVLNPTAEEGGLGVGKLDGGDGQLALADGEVHVVADEPVACHEEVRPVGECFGP